jgi:hypothetical protein
MLLHNDNLNPFVLIAHATELKETHDTMKMVLDHIKHGENR